MRQCAAPRPYVKRTNGIGELYPGPVTPSDDKDIMIIYFIDYISNHAGITASWFS